MAQSDPKEIILKINTDIGNSEKEITKLKNNLLRLNKTLGVTDEKINRLSADSKTHSKALMHERASRDKQQESINAVNKSLDTANRELKDHTTNLNNATRATARHKAAVKAMNSAYRGSASVLGGTTGFLISSLNVYALVGAGITKIAGDVFSLGRAYDSLLLSFSSVLPNMHDQADSLQFLSSIADQYGVELQVLIQTYAKFRAATKNTKLSTYEVNEIFELMTLSTSKLGLTTERTKLVMLALEQMMSKGVISMEELRRQLGESLPGAVAIMTKAYNNLHPEMEVSERQFQKLIEKGEILAADILPEFAKAYAESVNGMSGESIDTVNASMARLANTWDRFILSLDANDAIKAIITTLTGLVKVLELTFKTIADNKVVLIAFTAVVAALAFSLNLISGGALAMGAALSLASLGLYAVGSDMLDTSTSIDNLGSTAKNATTEVEWLSGALDKLNKKLDTLKQKTARNYFDKLIDLKQFSAAKEALDEMLDKQSLKFKLWIGSPSGEVDKDLLQLEKLAKRKPMSEAKFKKLYQDVIDYYTVRDSWQKRINFGLSKEVDSLDRINTKLDVQLLKAKALNDANAIRQLAAKGLAAEAQSRINSFSSNVITDGKKIGLDISGDEISDIEAVRNADMDAEKKAEHLAFIKQYYSELRSLNNAYTNGIKDNEKSVNKELRLLKKEELAEAKKATEAKQNMNKVVMQGFQLSADVLSSIIDQQKVETEAEFERLKLLRYGEAVINTAAGVTQALASSPPPYSFVLGGMVAAAGGIQIANIANQEFGSSTSSGSGSATAVPQHDNVSPLTNGRSLAEMERSSLPHKAFIVSTELQAHMKNDDAIKISSTL